MSGETRGKARFKKLRIGIVPMMAARSTLAEALRSSGR